MEKKRVKVYLGIPTVGEVVDAQAYMLRELAEKYKDSVEFVWPKMCVRRIFHDFARNEIVKEFLATDCDVLWFLDSDIGPSKHALDLISEHYDRWLVAGCPYAVFMTSPGQERGDSTVLWCVYRRDENGRLQPTDIPQSGTAFVDGMATGCLFIKREVFEMLKAPYFSFEFNPQTREPTLGEDLYFVNKCNAAGLQFFTDFTMVCKHYKRVCLLEVNNYAINFANQTLINYVESAKAEMASALREAFERGVEAGAKKAQPAVKKPQIIIP